METIELDLHGVRLGVETRGVGRDILYFGSGMWFADESAFVEKLATRGRVIAPIAPGFGPIPADRRTTSVDDLAYLYLDLIETMGLRETLVVGASFGGWIASEMAIKSGKSIAAMVLIDPLGIKISDRETRDIADFFGVADPELRARAYVDPSIFVADPKAITEAELTRRMRARESLARYGWSPFMHDPKLRQRLHRIDAPTLFIWGAKDRIVTPAYGREFARQIAGAQFKEIEGAAHFPQIERPDATIDAIIAFAGAPRAAHR